MDSNDREFFYFKCWMALKTKCPNINNLQRDIELEVGNFPKAKLLPEETASEPTTVTKLEDVEEIM